MQLNVNLSKKTCNWIELVLRSLQYLFSLFALAFVVTSFEVTKYTYGSDSSLRQSLATPTTNFVLLLTYSSLMYTLWYLSCVFWTHFVDRMMPMTEMAIDLVFAIAYLAGSIAFTCLPFHKDCDMFENNGSLHCDNMTASVTFCWLTFVLFLGSVAWRLVLLKNNEFKTTATNMAQVETPAAY